MQTSRKNQIMDLIRRPCRNRDGRPPILFIHGANADRRIWDFHFVDFFVEAGFDVWALSLRGHGANGYSSFPWPPGFSDYAEDVERAIRRIGETPVIVGHSMGGLVVQQVLKNGAIPIHAAVLMASVPPDGLFRPFIRLSRAHPVLVGKFKLVNASPRWMWEQWVGMKDFQQMFFSDSTPLENVAPFYSIYRNESLRAMADILFFNPPAKARLECPLLVMGAEEDRIITPEFVHETADAYSADVELLPRMGHVMMLEDRWETAARILLDWLNTHSERR